MNIHQPHAIGMDLSSLRKDGFVTVSYPPLLRSRVCEAMQSWKSFCNLSENEKTKLSGGDRIQDFGYMRRKDSGPRADNKELFHVVRKRLPQLHAQADAMSDRRAAAFIDAVDVLLQESVPLIQTFAQRIEQEYGLKGFEAEVVGSQDNWTFRYLHYFPGVQPVLANAHADRGGFTFHTWEDHDGGEYLSLNGTWMPWPVSDTKTIIFPSMGLQYRSKGELKALWHRVVPNETTAKVGRYSMVIFIDFKMDYRFDDSRYRIQDFQPGFNYQTSAEEFTRLFVPANGKAQTD